MYGRQIAENILPKTSQEHLGVLDAPSSNVQQERL